MVVNARHNQPVQLTHLHETSNHFRLVNQRAAVSSLSDDTLAHIFEICHCLQSPNHVYFERVVSAVMHRWRCVAASTPRIWTRTRHEMCVDDVELVATYLHRSTIHPFEIFFSIGSMGSKDKYAMSFLQLVSSEMGRCRRISIESFTGELDFLSEFLPMAAPPFNFVRNALVPYGR